MHMIYVYDTHTYVYVCMSICVSIDDGYSLLNLVNIVRSSEGKGRISTIRCFCLK